MLWTLYLIVTNVFSVETHSGTPTAVKPRTRVAVAARFVLAARTVVDTVTPDVDRQTIAVNWTLEVCVGTGPCILHGSIFRVCFVCASEVKQFGWRVGPLSPPEHLTGFIGLILTVQQIVTHPFSWNALHI